MKKLLLCLMATSSLYAVQIEVHNICGNAQPDTIKVVNQSGGDVEIAFAYKIHAVPSIAGWKERVREGGFNFALTNSSNSTVFPLPGDMTLCHLSTGGKEVLGISQLCGYIIISEFLSCPSGGEVRSELLPQHAFGHIMGLAYVKQSTADAEVSERSFGWKSSVEDGAVHLALTNNLAQKEPIPQVPYVTQKDLMKAYDLYRQHYIINNPFNDWQQFIGFFSTLSTGVTQDKRVNEIVTCLNSDSSEIHNIWYQIESIMAQSEKPDRIILNLLDAEFPGRVLPYLIRQQMKRGLEINWMTGGSLIEHPTILTSIDKQRLRQQIHGRPSVDFRHQMRPVNYLFNPYKYLFSSTKRGPNPSTKIDRLNNSRIENKGGEIFVLENIICKITKDSSLIFDSENNVKYSVGKHKYLDGEVSSVVTDSLKTFKKVCLFRPDHFFNTHYYDFMLYYLPSIYFLSRQDPEIQFFMPRNLQQYEVNAFRSLGIDYSKFLRIQDYIEDGVFSIRAEQAYFTSFNNIFWKQRIQTHDREYYLEELSFLKTSFLRDSYQGPKRKLYISRDDTNFLVQGQGRTVHHRDAVLALLQSSGFEIVSMGGKTIEEQAAIFNSAEMIIAPHGAGLTNIVFCEPGTKVLELMSPLWHSTAYAHMSNLLNFEHSYIMGSVSMSEKNNQANFDIDLNVLEEYLKEQNLTFMHGFSPDLYRRYVNDCTNPLADFVNGPSIDTTSRDRGEPEIIVSLTSWPKRIDYTYLAIEMLMRQTYMPHKICLWLAHEDFPDHKIPKTLEIQSERGLEIRFCENYGPATKLIPSLFTYPDAAIITVDDDIAYDSNLVQELVRLHQVDPLTIYSHRVRKIEVKDKKLSDYKLWKMICTNDSKDGLLFPTGIGGVLYPPYSLSNSVFNRQLYKDLSFHGDDIWFFAMAVLKGTKIKIAVPRTYIDIEIPELKSSALFAVNQRGRNDQMIKAVFSRFGIYEKLGLEG